MMKTRIKSLSRRSISTVLAILMVFSCLMVGTITANADNSVTFYIYPSDLWSDYASYTIKAKANIGDNNTWWEYSFSNTGNTINGKVVYSVTINEKYGGVDALKIIKYNGSTNVAEKQPYNSWTTSGTFSGKIYNGSSWADLPAYDITRAVVAGDIASSGWNNTADEMTASSGTFTKTYSSKATGNYTFAVFEYGNWDRSYRWAAKGTLTANNCGSWADANDGDHNIKLTLTKKANVTITFSVSTGKVDVILNPVTHSVSASSSPSNGTLKFSTDNSTWSDGPINVPEGDSYYVKATPSTGYKINSFTVGGSAVSGASGSTSAKTYTGTMSTSNVTAAASFAIQTFNVKKTESGTTGGTVTLGGTTLTTSNKSFNYGTNYSLSVTAPTGYNVTGISGVTGTTTGLNTSSASVTGITINANTTVAVTYAKKTYTVSKSETDGTGTVQVGSTTITTGGVSIAHGSYTVTITASSGKNVSAVSIGGVAQSITEDSTVTINNVNITAATTIAVTYVTAGKPSLAAISNVSKDANTTTFNVTATINDEDKKTGTLTATASSGTTSVATVGTPTVSGSTVTIPVTIKGVVGSSTITVTLKDGGTDVSTQTFSVSMAEPTFTIGAKTIYVSDSAVAGGAITNGGVAPSSISYSSNNTSYITVGSSNGKLTAAAVPSGSDQTATITAIAHYASGYQKSTTYTATLKAPTLTASSNKTSGNIGETATGSVSGSNPDPTSASYVSGYSWVSSNSNVVSITNNTTATPTFTFKKNGSATITLTVTYKNTGLTKQATKNISVNAPTVSLVTTTAQSLNVGGTHTNTATGSTIGSEATGSITYSVGNSTNISVNSSGVVTGLVPTSTAQTLTATYTVTCGGQTTTATKTCNYTVNTPTINASGITIAKGDSKSISATTSNPSGLTLAYALKSAVSGVSISGNTVSVTSGCSASSATVTITAKNSQGTAVNTKDVTVTIVDPSLTIGSPDVSGGTVYATVGTSISKTLSVNFSSPIYTISSSNTAAATVSRSGDTLTITPVAKGISVITVTATKDSTIEVVKTFNVYVAAADTYKYLYFTNGAGIATPKVYLWKNSNANIRNANYPGETMVKIGQNSDSQDVYAIRYLASQGYDRVIISNGGGGDGDKVMLGNTRDIVLSTEHNAIYCDQLNNNSKSGWWDCAIQKPQITVDSIDDLPVNTSGTLTATALNNTTPSSYKWVEDGTSKLTITNATTTTNTNTITAKNSTGTVNVNVKAYSAIPDNFNSIVTDGTADDYLADTASATVTITAPAKKVSWSNESRNTSDGAFTENNSAGTVTRINGPITNGGTVAHDTVVTFSAEASDGYKFFGWRISKQGSADTTSTATTINVTIDANTTVYARYERKYDITFNYEYASFLTDSSTPPTSVNSIYYNATPSSITLQLKEGFKLDWANSTNLSKYYNVPTSKINSVQLQGKVPSSDNYKVDTTVTIKVVPYNTQSVTYYVDLHGNCNNNSSATIQFCTSGGGSLYKAGANNTAATFSEVSLSREGTSTIYKAVIDTPYYTADGTNYESVYAKVRVNGGSQRKINLGSKMITDSQHEVWLDVVNKEKVSVSRTNTAPSSTNGFEPVASNTTRIYLKQASDMGSGWSDGAKIYYWNDDTQTYPVTWDNSPSMTKLGTDGAENVYYRYDIPTSVNQVIFRNSSGDEQTVDVSINDSNYFYMTKNSNTKQHNVEALEKVAIPSVSNAPTLVTAPLLDEDGINNSSFSVAPIRYTGSTVTYSYDDSYVSVDDSTGVATAQGDCSNTTITVKVKSAVAQAITDEENTKDYFQYSVSVTIIDSSQIDTVKLMAYNSDTSYYCIENYASTPHAEFLNAPTTALTSTYNSGSAVTRSYTGAGIVTVVDTRTGGGVTRYSVKYARCVNNATTYSNISLKVTLSTKADDGGNGSRWGFTEWQENTNPVTKYNKTDSSYKSYKNNGHACVDMTLDLNGNTFTAIYSSYQYVDAVVNYIYYDYNTSRGDGNDVYYYDAAWAKEPNNPSTTNPNNYYNDTADYQTSHVEKKYVTEEVEYRSDTDYGNGSALSNKNFRTIFSGSNFSDQARAIVDDNIKSFQSNYYNYRPYYGTNNDAIVKESYSSSTYKVVLNVYLYGTPRTYTVSYAGDDLESDENGAPIYYQSWVNLSSNNGSKKWLVNGTTVAIGNGYRFRVTGDTAVTTQEATAADAALSGKTVPQHANSTLSGNDTSTQQLTQSFYIQDFFDKTFYKYNDENDNNTEKEYDEITFVGGGVAYYSYNRAANALPADDTLTNNALVGKNYVHFDSSEGYVASTHTITRNDLYNESTNAYGVNGTATYIGDRIQYLIEKNKTNTDDEAENLANAYATEISGRQDKDEYNSSAKTGLMYRYLPYEQKYTLTTSGVQNQLEKTNSNIYRYSSQQQAYQFLYRLTMNNDQSNSTRYMRLYSFMVFSYRDYVFTDDPDGEVRYVLALSDNYADAPTYYNVELGSE